MSTTPDVLCRQFSDLANGVDDHDGLNLADVVHAIVEDVIDSAQVAITEMRTGRPLDGNDIFDIIQTVKDYYENHYGGL